MHGHGVNRVEGSECLQAIQKGGIDGRHAAQDTSETRVLGCDCIARQSNQTSELLPRRINLHVPMRFIVRLIPDLRGFNHRSNSAPDTQHRLTWVARLGGK